MLMLSPGRFADSVCLTSPKLLMTSFPRRTITSPPFSPARAAAVSESTEPSFTPSDSPPAATEMPPAEIEKTIVELEEEMLAAAEDLRFEYAAKLRDEIKELRRELDALAV